MCSHGTMPAADHRCDATPLPLVQRSGQRAAAGAAAAGVAAAVAWAQRAAAGAAVARAAGEGAAKAAAAADRSTVFCPLCSCSLLLLLRIDAPQFS